IEVIVPHVDALRGRAGEHPGRLLTAGLSSQLHCLGPTFRTGHRAESFAVARQTVVGVAVCECRDQLKVDPQMLVEHRLQTTRELGPALRGRFREVRRSRLELTAPSE